MTTQTTHRYTFPFLPILTIVFITLKLTGYIAWPWLWVLSPILIPIAIMLVILVVIGIVDAVKAASTK